jgi:glycosyltransferase involved in cell wall biosynthesis
MLIFFEKESGEIIAFMSSMNFFGNRSDALKSMFPDRDDVECSVVPVDCNRDLRHHVVEKNGPIVVRISHGETVAYEMSQEDLEAEQKRLSEERYEKKVASLPVKNDRHLRNVLEKHVYKYSFDSVRDALESGEYFDSDVMVAGWWGSFLDAGGYANMNREIVQRLHRFGVLPIVDIYPTPSQVSMGVESAIRDYSKLKSKKSTYPYVYAFTPMPHAPHSGKKIFFTMMETSTLHNDFATYCNKYSDEVWVPSAANRKLFAEHGVKKPIRVMPLGIDELIYFDRPVDADKIDLSRCVKLYGTDPKKHVGKFRFLTVIQWNIRKGYDALIKAFFNSFKKSDDVCLVIATQYSTETVKASLDAYVSDSGDAPQVMHYHGVIPINDMPHIYDACDCYVHLSRGEGFSLTQIEAAARGLPVISCFHSGMTEYMRPDNSYIVDCNSDSPCSPDLTSISCYYAGQRMWHVGSDQIEQAGCHMIQVASGGDEPKERANRMQKLVRDKFTWEICTRRIAEALKL